MHHQLERIPGIPSPSRSPAERRLAPFLTGELLTNVGPLEAGLGNAGVDVLLDLNQPPSQKKEEHLGWTDSSHTRRFIRTWKIATSSLP
jgi:hypothetical protein